MEVVRFMVHNLRFTVKNLMFQVHGAGFKNFFISGLGFRQSG